MAKTFNSTKRKAQKVKELVMQYYEEGRQDRCKRWVWAYKVNPEHPMSERTFFRLLQIAQGDENTKEKDGRQLELFNE